MSSWLHAMGIAAQLSLLVCAAFAAVACSSSSEGRRDARRTPRAPEAIAPPAYEPIEVVNGGTITGIVTWSGERPEPATIEVATHREVCGAERQVGAITTGRRGGVAGVVVWLDGITRGRALATPPEPVEIRAEGCAFTPHVLAVGVGTRLAIRNADPFLHNVHATALEAGTTWFSEGLAQAGAAHVAGVERPGVTRLVDDAGHPWMLAWVHAFEHPYFAVSDADGRFQITGIPSGQYTLRVWHEGVPVGRRTEAGRPVASAPIELTRPVAVSRGHDTTVDFVLTRELVDAAGSE